MSLSMMCHGKSTKKVQNRPSLIVVVMTALLAVEQLVAERTRYLKENPEGVNEVCKILEDMRNEAVERSILQTIRNLMETLKLSAEDAMAAMKIPDAERRKYIAKL